MRINVLNRMAEQQAQGACVSEGNLGHSIAYLYFKLFEKKKAKKSYLF